MKKSLIAIALTLSAISSFAGTFCDNQKTPQARQSCYVNMVGAMNRAIDNSYTKIFNSGVLVQEEIRGIQQDHTKWANWVNSACQSDACLYSEQQKRLGMLEQYYAKEIAPKRVASK